MSFMYSQSLSQNHSILCQHTMVSAASSPLWSSHRASRLLQLWFVLFAFVCVCACVSVCVPYLIANIYVCVAKKK